MNNYFAQQYGYGNVRIRSHCTSTKRWQQLISVTQLKLFVLIILAFSSCKNSTEADRISEFEKALGAANTKCLDDLVLNLDSHIETLDFGTDLKFQHYLQVTKDSNLNTAFTPLFSDQTCIRNIYFGKYDTIYPDSVWYENSSFHVTYADTLYSTEFIVVPFESGDVDIDSVIQREYSEPKLIKVEEGLFLNSLYSLTNKDSLISKYIDMKYWAGSISLKLVAGGLLANTSEENIYFAKRIFIYELVH